MPAAVSDPYLVLGVGRTATNAEIRAAYRALGARYHPDLHQGNPLEELASARMAEINQAYEILSDRKRRAAYDSGGWTSANGATAGGGAPGGWPGDAGGRFDRGGPRPRMPQRWVRVMMLLAALPFIVRLGGGIVRTLGIVARAVFEGLGAIRGTPAVAGAALLTVVLLVLATVRRRRRKQEPK